MSITESVGCPVCELSHALYNVKRSERDFGGRKMCEGQPSFVHSAWARGVPRQSLRTSAPRGPRSHARPPPATPSTRGRPSAAPGATPRRRRRSRPPSACGGCAMPPAEVSGIKAQEVERHEHRRSGKLVLRRSAKPLEARLDFAEKQGQVGARLPRLWLARGGRPRERRPPEGSGNVGPPHARSVRCAHRCAYRPQKRAQLGTAGRPALPDRARFLRGPMLTITHLYLRPVIPSGSSCRSGSAAARRAPGCDRRSRPASA